jgi:hypothetical protein
VIERETLRDHHAFVAGDNAWQQRARLTQALWRERQGLPAGLHRDAPLGSRLTPADAEPPTLANYMSAQARHQVETAVAAAQDSGALLSRPRLWVDLLSSQPLCFNLFGPLAEDLDLATAVLQLVWPHIVQVTEIKFEWSPGRGDTRYTGNRSAFDVFVAYHGDRGRGFLAIEVKYHENLRGSTATGPAQRYPTIAQAHGIFRESALPTLQTLPLQQLWLDHPPRPPTPNITNRRLGRGDLRVPLPDRQRRLHRRSPSLPPLPDRLRDVRRAHVGRARPGNPTVHR